MTARYFVTAALCLAAAASGAQDAGLARKTVGAVRVEAPPVLDGVLDDPAWENAAIVEDLHIVVSDEFGTPGERSRLYVAFDDDNLYFAARFYDSKPGHDRRQGAEQARRVLRRRRLFHHARSL